LTLCRTQLTSLDKRSSGTQRGQQSGISDATGVSVSEARLNLLKYAGLCDDFGFETAFVSSQVSGAENYPLPCVVIVAVHHSC
jgi:hypothetical protein